MLNIEDYSLYTLEEIEKESNENIRHQILLRRQKMLEDMTCNRIGRQIIREYPDASIVEINRQIELASINHISYSLFPENEVILYPQIKEVKSTKDIICDVSGGIIRKGSYYINYQALLDNLSTGKRYVLIRPLIAEIGNWDFFPSNIREMDSLDFSLKNAYNLTSSSNNDKYDYYDISTRIGEGIQLRLLGLNNHRSNYFK